MTRFATLRERELNALEDQRFREIQARLFSGSPLAKAADD